jgi:hypothetical protein
MTETEKEKWDWVLELYRAWKPQIKRGYQVLKYVSGSAFTLISVIGEYGSRDNIGITFIWSHIPKWNDRQGMFKLLSLLGVSFSTGYLSIAWPGMVYRVIMDGYHNKPSTRGLPTLTVVSGLWLLYVAQKVLTR